jgi:putative resolvase
VVDQAENQAGNQAEDGAENGTEDLLADLTAIVYSFCARLYGQRRAERKTETIVREVEAKGESDATG